MAPAYRITANFYPLLNSKYLKCSVNISRFKSKRSVVREIQSSLEKDESPTEDLNFHKMIQQRQSEAKRTVIVQLNKFNDAAECTAYLKTFGRISCMYHYVTKMRNPNMLLVQFKTKEDMGKLLNSVQYLDTSTYMGVPTTVMQYEADTVQSISLQMSEKLSFRKYSHHFPTWVMIKSNLLYSKSISEQMVILCKTVKLSDIDIRLRFFTAHQLCLTLGKLFPTLSILPFGSSVSGFGQLGSDLDIVCTAAKRGRGTETKISRQLIYCSKPFSAMERSEQQDFLKPVAMFLHKFIPGIINTQSILKARVPIIKFSNALTSMHCDLSSNNLSGFYMSEILYNYSVMDWRVKPLVFTLRKWAYAHGITSEVAGQKLTNFSLTLLIIFYLQQEKMLPPMRKMLIASNQLDENELSTFLRPVVRSYIDHTNLNNNTLEDLLFGFFQFYATFDFSMYAICMREGRTKKKPDISPAYLLNPLDPTLNVSRNVSAIELNAFVRHCISALNMYNDNKLNSVVNLIESLNMKTNLDKSVAESTPVIEVQECETEKDDDLDQPNKLEEIIK
ncbi:mitochondrial poly(A) polymerase [Halictus rubicundus]|uniref:mitochondrial poly(A) polymerase n=1 Tax=Halictus rubicundus TaxID=77578 RepID=UPI0040371156